MFDARNKGQPKLVYSRLSQNDAHKTDQQPSPSTSSLKAPLSKSNSLPVSLSPGNGDPLGSSKKDGRQAQRPMFNDMQKDNEQKKSNQQSSQFQKQQQQPLQQQQQQQQQHRQQQQQQQQQHGEMRQNTQHPLNITVVDVVSTKKQQTLKGDNVYKTPLQDTGDKTIQNNNSQFQSYGEMKAVRSREYEIGSEKRLVNDKLQTSSSSSSSTGLAADNEKKLAASTIGTRAENLRHSSTIDSNNAIFLRHPRIHSDSSVTPNRSQLSPQSPNQYLSPQQFMYYQQHQLPKQQQQQQHHHQHQQQQQQKQQQEIRKNVSSHPPDRRPRPEVVRVRSYSAGRQSMSTALHPGSLKSANPGQTWSIPRVSTTTRPHSLNVPYTRHDDGGSRSPTGQLEFSTYNPSASPRALRSQGKPHNEMALRQLSPTPSSSSNTSSNPPKSILKPTANQELPEVFFSSRPLVLPRAHSEKGNTHGNRDFDFSSILTTNKDIFTTSVPTIQVTSQPSDHINSSNLRPPLQRPLSANAGLASYDLRPDGRPIRKSVTFNSLVQLLHEDQISMVRSPPVDA